MGRRGIMNGIVKYLEEATWRGRLVEKTSMRMGEGHTWFHPLVVEQGVEYLVRIRGRRNVENVTCSIIDDYDSTVVREVTGRTLRILFVPERVGVHKMMVTLRLSHRAETEGKVGVRLLREHLPWRARNGLFAWSAPEAATDSRLEASPREATEGRYIAVPSRAF
jgi:hypothetical protein